MPENRRRGKRFDIGCPITLEVARRGQPRLLHRGLLLDIGDGGASFSLEKPVPVGARVVLTVHLASEERGVAATMRFDATVLRSGQELLNRTAVQFRTRGRFLRNPRETSSDRTLDLREKLRPFSVVKRMSLPD